MISSILLIANCAAGNALGDRLVHIHIHDNHGDCDDHLAVGQGGIDFDAFFEALFDLMRAEAQCPLFGMAGASAGACFYI